jgi:hypothetical protein
MRAFVVRDPDGYYVTVNELREEREAVLDEEDA